MHIFFCGRLYPVHELPHCVQDLLPHPSVLPFFVCCYNRYRISLD